MKVCLCWRSSEVERLPCKQRVGGSNPLASSSCFRHLGSNRAGLGRYPSGQRGQTVNLLAHAFGGSNPPLPTTSELSDRNGERQSSSAGGNSSAVERQPSKLGVAGSNPVSRSKSCEPQDVAGLGPRRPRRAREKTCAHVAQSAEHVLGKDGVTGSSPVMGSISLRAQLRDPAGATALN